MDVVEITMLRGKYCPYHEELVGPAPWVYQEWLKRLNPTTLLGITKGRLSFEFPKSETNSRNKK